MRRAQDAVALLRGSRVVHHAPVGAAPATSFWCDWCLRRVGMTEMRSTVGPNGAVWAERPDRARLWSGDPDVPCWEPAGLPEPPP